MRSKQEFQVIVLWGGQEVSDFYDHAAWTSDNARKILEHVDVYDFATEDEAEAFRMGLCAVKTPSAKDFTEITLRSYQALLELVSPPTKRSPASRKAA